MRDYEFIKGEIIERHKSVDDNEYLDKYINFLLNYKLDNSTYIEKHHILPRSTFPEYENESWNIIELDYESHRLVHLWLFKSINIRKYQRPLNYMMNYYKNSKEISNAAKKGWVNLKNDDEKYKRWKESRSETMKNLSTEEQSRRANIFWKTISEDEYSVFCSKMKDYWTEEKKIQKSHQMNEYYLNEENIEKKRQETKDRWDKLDDDYRNKFKEKMSIINKSESKRIDAGNKIREIWKTPSYLEKMKSRKKRNGIKINIIRKDGESEIFDNMEDVVRKYGFSKHLIRKYRDTDVRVSDKDSIELSNCIIKTIK